MQIGPGTVAVVTGAASGIGRALADAFADSGCSVMLADVEVDALVETERSLVSMGADVAARVVDVSKAGEVEALAAATVERFGDVHVVCNNAGVAPNSDAWFGPLATWEWVLGVNLWGVIHGIRSFLPHLIGGGGHIVNTASMAGLYPGFAPAYDASKHAVVALSEGLHAAMQTAGFPVGVSCLCPGWVRTGIVSSHRNWPAELGAPPAPDPASEVVRAHVARAIDEGTPPAVIADLVVDAVRQGRYWVLPHREFVEIAVDRWHAIADGIDPAPRERTPGLPPRQQIVDEVLQALTNALTNGATP